MLMTGVEWMGIRIGSVLAVALACLCVQATVARAADGDLVRTPDGATYRIVGGAPLWISSCAYSNSCAGVKSVDNLAAYKQYPADNAVVRNYNDGGYYRFVGGAPLLVRCDIGPNCVSPTTVDSKTFSNLGRPNATVVVHMRSYPPNNSVVKNADDGSIYRFAGNAPLPIAACTCSPTLIDNRTLLLAGTATPAVPHIAPAPAEGTFLVAGTTYYRVAGDAAVQLTNCAVLGNCAGTVTVDPATIAGLAGGRLLRVPRDGTVLRGNPSKQMWEIDGGYRHQTFANVAPIDVDDGAISLIPTPPVPAAPAPAPAPTPTPVAPFTPTVNFGYRVRGSRTQFTALSVSGLPSGATVTISCGRKGHGCPYKSHKYTSKTSRLKTPSSIKRAHLHSGATLTVTMRSLLGARKVVTFKTRRGHAPERASRCAGAGAKLTRC
jgi:hypothetical protein